MASDNIHGFIVILRQQGVVGSRFPVCTGACTIGRGINCSVRIHLPSVADKHCIISSQSKRESTIKNLSTASSTFLNGVNLDDGTAVLRHGDVITLGGRSFRWEYPPASQFWKKSLSDKNAMVKLPAQYGKNDLKLSTLVDDHSSSSNKQRKSMGSLSQISHGTYRAARRKTTGEGLALNASLGKQAGVSAATSVVASSMERMSNRASQEVKAMSVKNDSRPRGSVKDIPSRRSAAPGTPKVNGIMNTGELNKSAGILKNTSSRNSIAKSASNRKSILKSTQKQKRTSIIKDIQKRKSMGRVSTARNSTVTISVPVEGASRRSGALPIEKIRKSDARKSMVNDSLSGEGKNRQTAARKSVGNIGKASGSLLKSPRGRKRRHEAGATSPVRAAKILKLQAPKSIDKKKMAALIMCHGKSKQTAAFSGNKTPSPAKLATPKSMKAASISSPRRSSSVPSPKKSFRGSSVKLAPGSSKKSLSPAKLRLLKRSNRGTNTPESSVKLSPTKKHSGKKSLQGSLLELAPGLVKTSSPSKLSPLKSASSKTPGSIVIVPSTKQAGKKSLRGSSVKTPGSTKKSVSPTKVSLLKSSSPKTHGSSVIVPSPTKQAGKKSLQGLSLIPGSTKKSFSPTTLKIASPKSPGTIEIMPSPTKQAGKKSLRGSSVKLTLGSTKKTISPTKLQTPGSVKKSISPTKLKSTSPKTPGSSVKLLSPTKRSGMKSLRGSSINLTPASRKKSLSPTRLSPLKSLSGSPKTPGSSEKLPLPTKQAGKKSLRGSSVKLAPGFTKKPISPTKLNSTSPKTPVLSMIVPSPTKQAGKKSLRRSSINLTPGSPKKSLSPTRLSPLKSLSGSPKIRRSSVKLPSPTKPSGKKSLRGSSMKLTPGSTKKSISPNKLKSTSLKRPRSSVKLPAPTKQSGKKSLRGSSVKLTPRSTKKSVSPKKSISPTRLSPLKSSSGSPMTPGSSVKLPSPTKQSGKKRLQGSSVKLTPRSTKKSISPTRLSPLKSSSGSPMMPGSSVKLPSPTKQSGKKSLRGSSVKLTPRSTKKSVSPTKLKITSPKTPVPSMIVPSPTKQAGKKSLRKSSVKLTPGSSKKSISPANTKESLLSPGISKKFSTPNSGKKTPKSNGTASRSIKQRKRLQPSPIKLSKGSGQKRVSSASFNISPSQFYTSPVLVASSTVDAKRMRKAISTPSTPASLKKSSRGGGSSVSVWTTSPASTMKIKSPLSPQKKFRGRVSNPVAILTPSPSNTRGRKSFPASTTSTPGSLSKVKSPAASSLQKIRSNIKSSGPLLTPSPMSGKKRPHSSASKVTGGSSKNTPQVQTISNVRPRSSFKTPNLVQMSGRRGLLSSAISSFKALYSPTTWSPQDISNLTASPEQTLTPSPSGQNSMSYSIVTPNTTPSPKKDSAKNSRQSASLKLTQGSAKKNVRKTASLKTPSPRITPSSIKVSSTKSSKKLSTPAVSSPRKSDSRKIAKKRVASPENVSGRKSLRASSSKLTPSSPKKAVTSTSKFATPGVSPVSFLTPSSLVKGTRVSSSSTKSGRKTPAPTSPRRNLSVNKMLTSPSNGAPAILQQNTSSPGKGILTISSPEFNQASLKKSKYSLEQLGLLEGLHLAPVMTDDHLMASIENKNWSSPMKSKRSSFTNADTSFNFSSSVLDSSKQRDSRHHSLVVDLSTVTDKRSPRYSTNKHMTAEKLISSSKSMASPKNRLNSYNSQSAHSSFEIFDTADITSFDFDSVKTPNVPKEFLVSPNNTSMLSPNNLTATGNVKKLFQTRKSQKSPKNDLSDLQGVKTLFRSPRAQNSPRNDLTNVQGVRKLMKGFKSPNYADLSNFGHLFLEEVNSSPKAGRSKGVSIKSPNNVAVSSPTTGVRAGVGSAASLEPQSELINSVGSRKGRRKVVAKGTKATQLSPSKDSLKDKRGVHFDLPDSPASSVALKMSEDDIKVNNVSKISPAKTNRQRKATNVSPVLKINKATSVKRNLRGKSGNQTVIDLAMNSVMSPPKRSRRGKTEVLAQPKKAPQKTNKRKPKSVEPAEIKSAKSPPKATPESGRSKGKAVESAKSPETKTTPKISRRAKGKAVEPAESPATKTTPKISRRGKGKTVEPAEVQETKISPAKTRSRGGKGKAEAATNVIITKQSPPKTRRRGKGITENASEVPMTTQSPPKTRRRGKVEDTAQVPITKESPSKATRPSKRKIEKKTELIKESPVQKKVGTKRAATISPEGIEASSPKKVRREKATETSKVPKNASPAKKNLRRKVVAELESTEVTSTPKKVVGARAKKIKGAANIPTESPVVRKQSKKQTTRSDVHSPRDDGIKNVIRTSSPKVKLSKTRKGSTKKADSLSVKGSDKKRTQAPVKSPEAVPTERKSRRTKKQ